jgi:hypothetical protein
MDPRDRDEKFGPNPLGQVGAEHRLNDRTEEFGAQELGGKLPRERRQHVRQHGLRAEKDQPQQERHREDLAGGLEHDSAVGHEPPPW